jgi:hypothetical protein
MRLMPRYEEQPIRRFQRIGESREMFRVVGIDYGTDLIIMAETDKKILAYRKGRREWCAVGETRYYGPSFIVFTKKDKNTLISPLDSPEFDYSKDNSRKEALRKATEIFETGGFDESNNSKDR